MTTTAVLNSSAAAPEQRRTAPASGSQSSTLLLLHNVSWKTYECLLADFENRSAPRLTYDRGILQIMSPRPEHEERNRTLALLVEVFAEERSIVVRNLGSTTFRREDIARGFEPDSCFYVQNVGALGRVRQIDLSVHPAPDLVIEIDVTHPSLDKFPLYAQVGVPEVWRDDGTRVTIYVRGGDGYQEAESSRTFPDLTQAVLTEFVNSSEELDRLMWLRTVRAWARRNAPAGTERP